MAQKKSGQGRPVIAFIGDGSLQYSIQCLYSAVQHKTKVVFIVPCNGEYAILKEFAVLEKTPNVPGLDLPGLDVVSAAKAFGCSGTLAKTKDEIKNAFSAGDRLTTLTKRPRLLTARPFRERGPIRGPRVRHSGDLQV